MQATVYLHGTSSIQLQESVSKLPTVEQSGVCHLTCNSMFIQLSDLTYYVALLPLLNTAITVIKIDYTVATFYNG